MMLSNNVYNTWAANISDDVDNSLTKIKYCHVIYHHVVLNVGKITAIIFANSYYLKLKMITCLCILMSEAL